MIFPLFHVSSFHKEVNAMTSALKHLDYGPASFFVET